MGNNHSQDTQDTPANSCEAKRRISLQDGQGAATGTELVIGRYTFPKTDSIDPQLDLERTQLQHKPIGKRISSQRGYRPRSASLRRIRSIQRRRFLDGSNVKSMPPAKTNVKIEAKNKKLQEEKALLAACARGDLSKVEKLVDSGVDVNSSDENQRTALHYAAMYSRDNVIRSLISRGAEVNTTDLTGGFSAVHWVVIKATPKHSSTDHLESSLTALINAGCQVNATDFNFATPLHIAAQKGNRDAIQVLLRLGADPNKVDITGRDCFEVSKNEQMKAYMKTLLHMSSKKNEQQETRHIYHILEAPLPPIPAPYLTLNPPKILCTRKSSHEEHIYQTLEFQCHPSSPTTHRSRSKSPPPPPRRRYQYLHNMDSHLYQVQKPIPTRKSRISSTLSPPRRRKACKN